MDFHRALNDNTPDLPMIFLVGPTAIGKTELALSLAEEFGCEIIGVDSVQIYTYMDIGTAKPSLAERKRVPHHLIDYVFPDEEYSVSRFVADCNRAINHIRDKGKFPLLTGGTGLYFESLENGIFHLPDVPPEIRFVLRQELEQKGRPVLWEELERVDPVTASRIHCNDSYRLVRALEIIRGTGVTWSEHIANHRQHQPKKHGRVVKIGLARERDELYRRIDRRVMAMASMGLLEEVKTLLAMGYHKDLRPLQSLGYRHMIEFLEGRWSWDQTLEVLARDTRRYAKRQMTWFRADQEISWFHPDQFDEIKNHLANNLSQFVDYLL